MGDVAAVQVQNRPTQGVTQIRARKVIGRPDLGFHDLRHAAVTNMLDAGIDEARVMTMVGHKTFAMLKRYRIVADRHAVEAGQRLEAWQKQVASKAAEKPQTVK